MKKVLIIGSGRSGKAAAELLKSEAETFIWDDKMDPAGKPDVKEYDELLLSPGVSINHPMAKEAEASGVKVTGELETAYEHSPAKFIAITGTNGKTTTTTLCGEIFKAYFDDVRVGGNIGMPLSLEVMGSKKDTWMVTEVSSFQLETVSEFHPVVSAVLNITPDHLDRHGSFENYAACKARVTENQTENDFFVYNLEDEECVKVAEELKKRAHAPRLVPFSSKRKLPFEIKDIAIPGDHNMQNALAAAAIAECCGVPRDIILKVIADFKGVAHRLEFIRELDGVRYVNDSKGTNPDSSIKAIEAIKPPIILIAGGYEKNSDFTELIEKFDGKVKYILTLGFTGPRFAKRAVELGFPEDKIIACSDMKDCVMKGRKLAEPGDTLLLSPASASWDMYKNFEERGDDFRNIVNSL